MEGFKEEPGNIFLHKPSKILSVHRDEETNDKFFLVAFVPDEQRRIKYAPSICPVFTLDEHKELLIEFFM
jgi:hypothetical protein